MWPGLRLSHKLKLMVDRWIFSQSLLILFDQSNKIMTLLRQSSMSLEAVKVFFLKFVYFCLLSQFHIWISRAIWLLYITSSQLMINVTSHTCIFKKISGVCVCVFSACILCAPRLRMVVATCGCWKWNLNPPKNTCSSLLSPLSCILDVFLCETLSQG